MKENNYKLEFCFLHKEEITNLLLDEYSKDKIKVFGFLGVTYFGIELLEGLFETSDWYKVSKAIIVDNKIIGIANTSVSRENDKANLSIFLFNKSKRRLFFKALTEFIHELFYEYYFLKIDFTCFSFNQDAFRLYENLSKRNYIRKVGFKSSDFKIGNEYYNTHLYEMKKDQFDIIKAERGIK